MNISNLTEIRPRNPPVFKTSERMGPVLVKQIGLLLLLFVIICIDVTSGSIGDRSFVFQKCKNNCLKENCTEKRLPRFRENQPTAERLLHWSCLDECQYQCMWITVNAFQRDGSPVPQFFGKWPFIRILGIQEPASMVFSLMNGLAHLTILKYRRLISSSTPMYYVWHGMALVAMNAWTWSTIFHSRDTDFTEKMDYFCAFSIVMYGPFMLACRWLGTKNWKRLLLIALGCVLFYTHHVCWLGFVRFDYGYNMQVNITVALCNMIGWFIWCIRRRKEQPYVWKCLCSGLGINVLLSLELLDFPPILWTFDAHSLWHAGTPPLALLWYSFVIDDGLYLQSQTQLLPKKAA